MAKEDDRSDEQLCLALATGDEAALRLLMSRYRDRVYSILIRSTGRCDEADDLFQELWLRVVRSANDFDASLRFSSWLFRIAVNLTRDAARRRSAGGYAQITSTGELPDGASEAVLPDDAAASAQEERALHAALGALPAGQREVVVLRYLEGLGEQEVAEVVGIPAGTVKSRLHHAVKRLRAQLAPLLEKEAST